LDRSTESKPEVRHRGQRFAVGKKADQEWSSFIPDDDGRSARCARDRRTTDRGRMPSGQRRHHLTFRWID
jgi:hypothetical protein